MRFIDIYTGSRYLNIVLFIMIPFVVNQIIQAFLLGLGRKRKFLLAALLTVESALLYIGLMHGFEPVFRSGLPVLVLCAVIIPLNIRMEYVLHQWKNTHLTGNSVKEAMDRFPAGICIAEEDGTIVLTNLRMNDYLIRYLGGIRRNTKGLPAAEGILPQSDGTVLQLNQYPLKTGEMSYQEIIATDVTEEYRLTEQLEEENARLEDMKRRLLIYSDEVEEITRSEEILAAKTAIHNRIGQTLLATRHWLEHPAEIKEEQIMEDWQKIMFLLEGGPEQEESDTISSLVEAGQTIGVNVVINGTLPPDLHVRKTIAAALHECLTNTKKHAHGDRLTVDIAQEGQMITVSFSSNGLQPQGPVRETGGLGYLRQQVEKTGGEMIVETEPAFRVVLRLFTRTGLQDRKQFRDNDIED